LFLLVEAERVDAVLLGTIMAQVAEEQDNLLKDG
jgi:hypothetical protein